MTTQGPDYSQFAVAGVTYPLSTSSSNALLQDADPAIFYFLDFIQGMLELHVGKRFVAEANNANRPDITDVVVEAYPYEPLPHLLETQYKFPALFVYRTRVNTEQWTVGSDHDLWGVHVVYVLPPLDAKVAEKVQPILKSVYDVIRRKTTDASDPNYAPPGGNPGDQFTSKAYANLEEIGFGLPIDRRVAGIEVGGEIGHFPGTGDNWFPMVALRGYFIERDAYNPTPGGPSKFQGADITGNLLADDGTKLLATATTVAQASTQPAPMVTGLLTTTGPVAGGTPVTVEGTGFLQGPPQVFFGPANDPQYAASVQYQSADLLVVVTPPVSGPGTLDITVVNRDGQSAKLAAAFTFT